MSKCPLPAQVFLCAIWSLGVLSAVAVFTVIPAPAAAYGRHISLSLLPLLVFGAVVAGQRKLRLFGKDEGAGTMSLSYALIYATLLLFGSRGALLSGVCSTAAACIFQPRAKRQAWFQVCFNLSLCVIEIVMAGTVFQVLNGGTLALSLVHSPLAICAAALIFFFCNTISVSTIIGLCTRESPLSIWRESFMWTSPSFLLGAGGAAAVALISQLIGRNWATSFVSVTCMVVMLCLIQATYKVHVERSDALHALVISQKRLAHLHLATIRSLVLAIDAKDQYTGQHILRVQHYAVATAQAMGVVGDELKAIETGALLHDIGKLGVPEHILMKPGRLSEDEIGKIREHPRIGADILDPVDFPWPVLPVVKYHHERIDGGGYPEGLCGDQIPRGARILAVADVYDALTSERSYRQAWTHERAMEKLKSGAGTEFDPIVVDAFVGIVDAVRATMQDQGIEERPDVAATSKPDSIATTDRSALAVRDIRRASTELWALYEVAQTLSANLGLQDVVRILASKLHAIFPGTGCAILLNPTPDTDRSSRGLVARAAVGLCESYFGECRTFEGESLSVRVAWSGESYRGGYDQDDLMLNGATDGSWCELRSALIVPVAHKEYVLGTINLYHSVPGAFSDSDQDLLELIANRVAVALFNGIVFERTRTSALTDALTGLPNLRQLSETIETSLIHEKDRGFALLCVDVNDFKPINDNFGHRKGDEVLVELGHLMTRVVGPSNLVARYGGDEFVIIVHGAGEFETRDVVRRLHAAVADYQPNLVHPRLGDLKVTLSIGSACFPTDGCDGTTLLSTADTRMYGSKTEYKLGRMVDIDRSFIVEPLKLGPPPRLVSSIDR